MFSTSEIVFCKYFEERFIKMHLNKLCSLKSTTGRDDNEFERNLEKKNSNKYFISDIC